MSVRRVSYPLVDRYDIHFAELEERLSRLEARLETIEKRLNESRGEH